MLKILIKAAILVFIILSVYFIIHPSACSNLMLGRVTNPAEPAAAGRTAPEGDHGELFVPAGDRGVRPVQQEQAAQQNTEQPAANPVQAEPAYSQEDIDYAVASRYVELENEYARQQKVSKDTAKEISYKVMDDFEMTSQEWEDFLQRATQTNLFNRIRSEMADPNAK